MAHPLDKARASKDLDRCETRLLFRAEAQRFARDPRGLSSSGAQAGQRMVEAVKASRCDGAQVAMG